MDQISEYINFSNHRIHSYDKMRNMIVNLGSKKGKNNNNHSPQLTRIHNSLLITIVDTHENYLSNIEGKYDMTQVRTSSVNPSSTLFLCSVRAMYNIINKKNSHVEIIHSWDRFIDWSKEKLLPPPHQELVNRLNDWKEKHPHVIQSPNVLDSKNSKFNDTLVKKQNNLIKI